MIRIIRQHNPEIINIQIYMYLVHLQMNLNKNNYQRGAIKLILKNYQLMIINHMYKLKI